MTVKSSGAMKLVFKSATVNHCAGSEERLRNQTGIECGADGGPGGACRGGDISSLTASRTQICAFTPAAEIFWPYSEP